MNDINEMPPKCQYCPYWEVCEYPWVCPDREQLATNLQQTCHATDTISRQAAIDAVKKNTFRLTFAEEQNCEGHLAWSANAVYSDVIEGALLELPSAQPETTERTTETAQNVSDGDLISRKAAIDALRAMQTYKLFAGDDLLLIDQAGAQTELMMLPSAQPEPLTGKEKMIFLAAMAKEENICKQIDDEYRDCELYEDSLVRVCQEIERKVRGALWT